LLGFAEGGQQQRREDGNDRYYDQQLNQRERTLRFGLGQ